MPDEMKNLTIGIFVVAALGIVVFILLYLHPTVGDDGQVLYAWFSDVDKVNVGTRVTFAGRPVGEVTEIIERKGRTGPADEYGRLYAYQLKLVLDSGVEVYNIDQFSLRTSGLLGERSVSIMPMVPTPAEKKEVRLLTTKDVIYAAEAGSVEDTMKEFKEVADNADKALQQIALTLEDVRREGVIPKLAVTIENIGLVAEGLNKPEQWSTIVNNIEDVTTQMSDRMSPTWDTLDKSLNGLSSTMENAEIAMADAKEVIANTKAGRGSLGGLFVKDDLYLQLKGILSKADMVANDVNHYGLLFHSDKGWQRLRARRMNLLSKLCTPQEFRNYFNDEMDQINASLARVYMMFDETDMACPTYILGDDCDFRRVFADLLRRAGELEESLMLYNQQLNDCQEERVEFQFPCCY